jgi:uncharacterized membrane protein
VVALAVCYPLVAHLAVLTRSPRLTLCSIAVLVTLALWPALARRSVLGWLGALAAAALLAVAFQTAPGWTWLALYAPPVLGDAFLAWVFGHTLAPPHVPLIERMVRLLHAPAETLDAAVIRYARSLTAAWSALFGAFAVTNLLLALCAIPDGILSLFGIAPPIPVPQRAWSWFANIAEYLIAAIFLAGEYLYRTRRFPEQRYEGLTDFVRRLSAIAPGALASAPKSATRRVSEQT